MAHTTSATPFLTLEKSFGYRGEREHWVNTYHMDQVPPQAGDWSNLADAVWALESKFLDSGTQLEWAYGHTAGTPPVLVWEKDYPPLGEGGLAGTYVPAANEHPGAGDTAVWIRYGTTQKSVLGKPIYLRNYYHRPYSVGVDDVATAQKDFMLALGAQWVAGFTVGQVTYRRAGPRGAVAQNYAVSVFVTTRTLKHRGKRHHYQEVPAGFFPWKSPGTPPILIN